MFKQSPLKMSIRKTRVSTGGMFLCRVCIHVINICITLFGGSYKSGPVNCPFYEMFCIFLEGTVLHFKLFVNVSTLVFIQMIPQWWI